MKAADLFIKVLENEGVEYIFGIPGEENLDLVESLKKSTIKLIITRHEQAAGFMAATYGRLTGKVGVCLSTLGPGATNFTTAAAYAQLGGMPMLMITGQKPLKHSKQAEFQIVDIVELMKPVTKKSLTVMSGDKIPYTLRELFRTAKEERPGAVHIELAEDIAREEVDEEHTYIYPVNCYRRAVPDSKGVAEAVKMIEEAQRPLILVGAGTNRKRTAKGLIKFIKKTGINYVDTQMGKGILGGVDDYYIGNTTLSSGDFVHCAIDNADLIINIGHDTIEKPPFIMHHNGRKVIHINFSAAKIDSVYFPQVEIVGDVANALWQINEQITKQGHWDHEYFDKIQAKIQNHLLENITDERFPMMPQRIVSDTRAMMPKDGILTLDNGMYKLWFARNYKCYEQNTILLDNALATMGAGLPSAIAAKLVSPERKVMAVVGDGGMLMNAQELETAVRLKLDLVILIIHDGGFGMIKWKQQGMGMKHWGLDFGNPDFVQLAKAYGAHGHRITQATDLQTTLKECLTTKGVHIIDCPVDYSENARVFSHDIHNVKCDII